MDKIENTGKDGLTNTKKIQIPCNKSRPFVV